jgi:hypothetical protein
VAGKLIKSAGPHLCVDDAGGVAETVYVMSPVLVARTVLHLNLSIIVLLLMYLLDELQIIVWHLMYLIELHKSLNT